MKLWIFDLDGTLTDSFPVFFRAMQGIFAGHGKPLSEEMLHAALGSTMPNFFGLHLGEEHSAKAVEDLCRLSIEHAGDVRPFAGIEACLADLQASGREIAVWTARDRDSAEKVLSVSGLGRYASHLVSGNCVRHNKPDPEGARKVLAHFRRGGEETVMIGDHHHDVNGARAAGLTSVRASWNPYWKSERCELAHHQFFRVEDFSAWARGFRA
jgi:pyrophosphatase PpaX